MTNVLLFGVSCVGKTTLGALLAQSLGYEFFDLDEETKKYYSMTLEEFVHTGTLRERDTMRSALLKRLLECGMDKVVAVTPISYAGFINDILQRNDVVAIVLEDTPEHIFDRLVFSDENDVIYRDDEYKNARKDHYMEDIAEDIRVYNMNTFRMIDRKFFVNGETPETAVERLIEEFGLKEK